MAARGVGGSFVGPASIQIRSGANRGRQVDMGLDRVGEAVEIGLAAGGEIDRAGPSAPASSPAQASSADSAAGASNRPWT